MGSWYETCLISNLPIVWHTDARLVVLTQNNGYEGQLFSGGFCYATGTWHPRALPIKGKYNDQGTLEKIPKNLNTEILLDSFAAASVIPDDRDRIKEVPKKLNKILDLVERGRIKDKDDYAHRPVLVGQTLIREDVYQAVLRCPLTEFWFDAGLDFQKAEAERYLEECIVRGRKLRAKDFDRIFSWRDDLKEGNAFLKSSDSGTECPRCIWQYKLWLEEKCFKTEPTAEEKETYKQLLHEMVELLHINRFMQATRKHWSPQQGKGSQDRDLAPYVFLAKEIIAISEKSDEED